MSTVQAILIDPEPQTVEFIELPRDMNAMLDAMREIVGGDMDNSALSEMKDTIWTYEFGLVESKPIHAFRLPIRRDPYAGKAIIIGESRTGKVQRPYLLIDVIRRDVEWLGEIIPETQWVDEEGGSRAVVTYSRPKTVQGSSGNARSVSQRTRNKEAATFKNQGNR